MSHLDVIDEIRTDAIVVGNELNLARAFPSIRDGLKPSQRSVLYAAYYKGYSSNKPHIKSANLDGQVMAQFWPHGSQYPTITRLTQPFVLNLPLLDMHGANGSQLNTPEAASSRYTEVRLAKVAEDGFFANIDKNTCDWIPNYSEDLTWPKIFPALIPNLFVNGTSGMGYCYSQEWAPGNLNEFRDKAEEFLKTGKVTYDNLYPDFPTKGIIVNKSEMANIYKTGTGNIILRGRAEIVDNNIIKITELPYQVYVSNYIDQLIKCITPDKQNKVKIPGIEDYYNMSGNDGILIEIECNEDPQLVLNQLYKYTDLQITISVNQYALIDGLPELVTFYDYMVYYIKYNIECIQREYTYNLERAQARLEVVAGLLLALDNIDKIIDTIRHSKTSDEAQKNLMSSFKLSEVQAKAITDMRLGKLANLEVDELKKEKAKLETAIQGYEKMLNSETKQKNELLKRLNQFTDDYGWERRTEVTDVDLSEEEVPVVRSSKPKNETFVIALTADNHIKRINPATYKPSKNNTGSNRIITALSIGAKDYFILISESGKMYKLQTNKINLCNVNSVGDDLQDILNDKIVNIYTGLEVDPYLFFITNTGKVKKIKSDLVFSISKKIGTPIMKLNPKEFIKYSLLVSDGMTLNYTVGNKVKTLEIDKINCKGRSAGSIAGLKVKEGQSFSL